MALAFAHGAIQWLAADVATTVYTVSGLSFQPKAIRFYWQGLASAVNASSTATHERAGVGVAVSTAARRCVAVQDQDGAGSMTCTTSAWTDCIAATVTSTPARDGALDLNSITADGFTLIVDDQAPADLTIFWEAWGGDDITDVAVGDFAEPAAIGNQSYTTPGFEPAVVMMAGVQATSLGVAARGDSGLYVSAVTGTDAPSQFVLCTNNDDGSASSDTNRYYQREALAMITVAGGNPSARAVLNAFLPTGFELNWTARATTNRRSIFLCLKGGRWQARTDSFPTGLVGETLTIAGLSFTPVGILVVAGAGVILSTPGTANLGETFSWGTATSPSSRRAMAATVPNGTGNSEIDLTIRYDAVADSGLLVRPVDVNAFNVDGIEYILDASTVPNAAISTLLFGSVGAPPVSATPPAPVRLGDLIGPTPNVVVGPSPAILPGRIQL
jgi:hypothetical protein